MSNKSEPEKIYTVAVGATVALDSKMKLDKYVRDNGTTVRRAVEEAIELLIQRQKK